MHLQFPSIRGRVVHHHLDWAGFATLIGWIVPLLLALTWATEYGWGATRVVSLFIGSTVMLGVLIVIGFAFLNWGINFALARWGTAWDIRDITDVAVLPLASIVLSFFFFVTTPIGNTITRTMEFEADMYGLNAARQPDAEANVDMFLGEYRKLDPGPVEEFLCYDHPSGRVRITAAMRWKAEHLETTSVEEMNRELLPQK